MDVSGVDGVDVVIGTSSFLREHSHGKDMTWITKTWVHTSILSWRVKFLIRSDDVGVAHVLVARISPYRVTMSLMIRHHSAIEVIEFVKSKGIQIRFSSEDSFRSELVDLLSIYRTVDKIGVNRVGVADTVGCADPRQVYDLVRTLRGVVSCDIETHFHNDTGCGESSSRRSENPRLISATSNCKCVCCLGGGCHAH